MLKQNLKKRDFLFLAIAFLLTINLLYFYFPFEQKLTGKATDNPFNLEVKIPYEYSNILPGETIYFTTKIMNLANKQRKDITLSYIVLDKEEKKIVSKTETVAIETQASFVGNIMIPKKTPLGDYILEVAILGENEKTAIGKTSFKVEKQQDFKYILQKYKKIIIPSIIILIIIFLGLGLKTKIKEFFKKRAIKNQVKAIVHNRKKI